MEATGAVLSSRRRSGDLLGDMPAARSAVSETNTAPIVLTEFADFYEQNIDALISALSVALVDPSLAQDAAQEAMTRACQKWSQIGTYANPMGWCYRVAINWTTSRWRKRRREVTTDTFGPVAAIADVQITDYRVVDALMQLDLDQRSVVVLRLWMDWSLEETAEALGIAPGTVASRQHRALARLRRLMGADSREVTV